MSNEGRTSLDLWLKLTAGISCFVGVYVWNAVQAAQGANNENKQQIAVMQVHLKNTQDTLAQHAQLFTELRGMIIRNEDIVRKTTESLQLSLSSHTTTLDKLITQQNQILDDLHWVKAGVLTDRQSNEIEQKVKSQAEGNSAATAAATK